MYDVLCAATHSHKKMYYQKQNNVKLLTVSVNVVPSGKAFMSMLRPKSISFRYTGPLENMEVSHSILMAWTRKLSGLISAWMMLQLCTASKIDSISTIKYMARSSGKVWPTPTYLK